MLATIKSRSFKTEKYPKKDSEINTKNAAVEGREEITLSKKLMELKFARFVRIKIRKRKIVKKINKKSKYKFDINRSFISFRGFGVWGLRGFGIGGRRNGGV
jgi:hypothetical protein